MDKKILIGGAVAVGAYFWWASRSTAATPTAATRTPSTTPNGVGFNVFDSLFGQAPNNAPTTAPDATVKAPAPAAPAAPTNPAATEAIFSGGVQNDGRATSKAAQSTLGIWQQMDIGQLVRGLDFTAGNEGASSARIADYMAENKVSAADFGASIGWSGDDVSTYIRNATGRTV